MLICSDSVLLLKKWFPLLYTFDKVVDNMNRIKELRTQRGMKQADLAQLLNVTRVSVSRYETGDRSLDAPTICALCDIFGCTADYLLGRSILPAAELTEEEAVILLAWREASPQIREAIAVLLRPSSDAAVAR